MGRQCCEALLGWTHAFVPHLTFPPPLVRVRPSCVLLHPAIPPIRHPAPRRLVACQCLPQALGLCTDWAFSHPINVRPQAGREHFARVMQAAGMLLVAYGDTPTGRAWWDG